MIVRDKLGNRIELGELLQIVCQDGNQQVNVYGRPIEFNPGGVIVSKGSRKGGDVATAPTMKAVFYIDIPLDPTTGQATSVVKVVDPAPEQAEAIRKQDVDSANGGLIKLH